MQQADPAKCAIQPNAYSSEIIVAIIRFHKACNFGIGGIGQVLDQP